MSVRSGGQASFQGSHKGSTGSLKAGGRIQLQALLTRDTRNEAAAHSLNNTLLTPRSERFDDDRLTLKQRVQHHQEAINSEREARRNDGEE